MSPVVERCDGFAPRSAEDAARALRRHSARHLMWTPRCESCHRFHLRRRPDR